MVKNCKIVIRSKDVGLQPAGSIKNVIIDDIPIGNYAYAVSLEQDGPFDLPTLTIKLKCRHVDVVYQDK